MNKKTIFICGTYDLIKLIGETVINTSKKVYLISCDDPVENTFMENDIHNFKNQSECEKFILDNIDDDSFLISCYWPWKFSKKIVNKFKFNSINFHPSPLPMDKGWYPHVHQIRKNEISGVTLHIVDEKLDKGDIWVQNIFKLPQLINAGEAHDLLKKEIVKLFTDNWIDILEERIKPTKQKNAGNFYSKFELDTPELIELKEGSNEDTLLRLLCSRNLKNNSFIKVKIGDDEKFVHINFSEDGNLS